MAKKILTDVFEKDNSTFVGFPVPMGNTTRITPPLPIELKVATVPVDAFPVGPFAVSLWMDAGDGAKLVVATLTHDKPHVSLGHSIFTRGGTELAFRLTATGSAPSEVHVTGNYLINDRILDDLKSYRENIASQNGVVVESDEELSSDVGLVAASTETATSRTTELLNASSDSEPDLEFVPEDDDASEGEEDAAMGSYEYEEVEEAAGAEPKGKREIAADADGSEYEYEYISADAAEKILAKLTTASEDEGEDSGYDYEYMDAEEADQQKAALALLQVAQAKAEAKATKKAAKKAAQKKAIEALLAADDAATVAGAAAKKDAAAKKAEALQAAKAMAQEAKIQKEKAHAKAMEEKALNAEEMALEKAAAAKAAKEAEKAKKPKKVNLKMGVVAHIIAEGKGTAATNGKQVTVHYTGRLTNGKKFDSSVGRRPFTFRLGAGEVIKGWDIGMRGAKPGAKLRLQIPAKAGYGKRGAPPDIPGNATLVFDVAILRVA